MFFVLAHAWTGTQTNGEAALYVFNRGEEVGVGQSHCGQKRYVPLYFGDTLLWYRSR